MRLASKDQRKKEELKTQVDHRGRRVAGKGLVGEEARRREARSHRIDVVIDEQHGRIFLIYCMGGSSDPWNSISRPDVM